MFLPALVHELDTIAGGSTNLSGPNMVSATGSVSVGIATALSSAQASSVSSSSTTIPLANIATIERDALLQYYIPVAQPEYHILWSAAPSDANSTSLMKLELVTLRQPDLVFCPQGSGRPQVVLPGYYSSGGNSTTRSSQVICRLGTYCINGVSTSRDYRENKD